MSSSASIVSSFSSALSRSILPDPPIQSILNFSMKSNVSGIHYLKTFSKGQMTIPKTIRDYWGVGDEFWLKLKLQPGSKATIEPTSSPLSGQALALRLNQLPESSAAAFESREFQNIRSTANKDSARRTKGWS